MRFSVDAHAIGLHLTGNEVHVRNLLGRFAVLDDTSEFIAYYSDEGAPALIPSRFVKRRVARNPFLRLGFDIPRYLCDDCPDLLHVQYTAPWNCSCPVVVTVHDVSFLKHPEYFSPARSVQLRLTVKHTVQRAARVITVSEFSKREILGAYGIPSEKVAVIPNAVSSASFRVLPRAAAAVQVCNRWDIGAPFVLTVGDLRPSKNHAGLIAAFEEMLREAPQLPHHLVIVGKDTGYGPRIRRVAEKSAAAERIHFTGFVTDEELLQLYGACDVFAFPSFYEGFGLPILEAMACGRAVACSNTSAMPEVANATALLFDPKSVSQMTRALLDLLRDPELRGRMERLGLHRASLFSWERSAKATLDVYYEVAGASATKDRAALPVASRR